MKTKIILDINLLMSYFEHKPFNKTYTYYLYNMRKIYTTTLIMFLCYSFYGVLSAQIKQVEQQVLFQNRINNPIEIEVQESNNKYQFIAQNRSYYPYQVELNFSNLQNLRPVISKRTYYVMPGQNRLFTLTIADDSRSPYFEYSIKYHLGKPSEKVEPRYPYLIPIKNQFDILKDQYSESIYYKDCFVLNKTEIVYCMRKGLVVAVPDMYDQYDRISNKNSLEIMHDDGTIMIYQNINPDSLQITIGSLVYPSQPLGIINKKHLETSLYMIDKSGNLKRLDIFYSIDGNKCEQFNRDFISRNFKYDESIIFKELSRRQQKKFIKGSLF